MRHLQLRLLNLLCLVILSFSFTGCQGEQVGSGLDQNRANHMAAVLNAHGISAAIRKESSGRGNFSVWVERSDRGQAASLIDEKGLLERSESSLEELLSNQGILPGSREIEQLKLDRALGIQVEKLLENIPGVVSARVVVRQNFLKENILATVSAVIETEPQRSVDREDVLLIIERAVPGVDREHIIVSEHRGEAADVLREQIGVMNIKGKPVPLALTPFLGMWRIPKDDYASLAFVLVGLLVACAFVGVVVGYWYGYYIQSRHLFDPHSMDLVVPKVTRMDMLKGERIKFQ